METELLIGEKANCCGCGACVNACPKGAIRLRPDENGFLYPEIDPELCVDCGLCKKACGFQNIRPETLPLAAYAGAVRERQQLLRSASGGVAAALSRSVVEQGGVVFGCAMESREGNLCPAHAAAENMEQLPGLQGSKYVQSYIGDTYRQAKEALQAGRQVLFTGTPCQIAGLRGYLGQKDYPNLLTVDIICHGVPSNALFRAYLKLLEGELRGNITNFTFRDKATGWGHRMGVTYRSQSGKLRYRLIPAKASSYFGLFLQGQIGRDSCYSCPYAQGSRVGDLTLGDYWGIAQAHPEYLQEQGGALREGDGISCLLVNTPKGAESIRQIEETVTLLPSEFEKVQQGNDQLQHPCPRGADREKVLELYRQKGYGAVEHWYRKRLGIRWYRYAIQMRIPPKLRALLKR